MGPPYRDYLPSGTPPPGERPPPLPPRSGEGTVWMNRLVDDGVTKWWASWQDDGRVLEGPTGTYTEVATWARWVPANRRMIFDTALHEMRELTDDD